MNERNKRPVIVLTGPTAVGKTKTSIALAKRLQTSIISADSMQVYKYMDIGSAKIMPDEMEHVTHYLVDVFEPSEEFHVVRFQEEAKKAMELIWDQGKIPLVVGGTGFYIQALLYDIDFQSEDADLSIRRNYEAFAAEHGAESLHQKLAEVDPRSAREIHANNVKRVIRALEFYEKNGYPISQHNETERQKESPYNFAYFVLTDDRKKLYRNIDARVYLMMRQGLLDEVRHLKEMGYTKADNAMQGLGYKELLDYLDGMCTLDEAVSIIKRDTRHFAKRQLTWFRREKDVTWLDKSQFATTDECLDQMMKVLKEKQII